MFENCVNSFMNKKHLTILFLFLVNCAVAQVKHTLTKATVTFKIKNLGINTGGSFGGVQANIMFDPANLGGSAIQATADAATINTDNDMRDEHLKGDSYFDVTKYPKITIKSVSLKHKSGNNYSGQFSVTIKDKTQTLEMPFTYIASGNTASFNGTLKLKRTDFGIGSSSMVMSDDVTVTIDAETNK
jgi:polyisoprenoid-binding protein YceI